MCHYHWDKYTCPFCQQSTPSSATIRQNSDICRYAKRRSGRHRHGHGHHHRQPQACRTLRAGGTREEARRVTYKSTPDRTVVLTSGKPCGSARCKELVQQAQWREMVRAWWAGQARREGRTGVERWREDVAVQEAVRAWKEAKAERRREARMERWRMGCETIREEETLGEEGGRLGAGGGAGEGDQYRQDSSSNSSSSSHQQGQRPGANTTSASHVANGTHTPLQAPRRAPSACSSSSSRVHTIPSNGSGVSASRPPVRSPSVASSLATSSGYSSYHRSATDSVFSKASTAAAASSSGSSTATHATSRTRGSNPRSDSAVGGARSGRTWPNSSSSSSRSSVASSATRSNQSTSKALVLWSRGQTRAAEAPVSMPTLTPTSSSTSKGIPLTSQALVLYGKRHSPPGSVATSAAATLATTPTVLSSASASQTPQTPPPSSRTADASLRRRPAPSAHIDTSSTATSLRVHPPQSISSSVVSVSSRVSSNSGGNYPDYSNHQRRYAGSTKSAASYPSVSPMSSEAESGRPRRRRQQRRRYGASSVSAGSQDARSFRSVSPMSSISNRPERGSGKAMGLGIVNPLRRLLGLRGKAETQ